MKETVTTLLTAAVVIALALPVLAVLVGLSVRIFRMMAGA